MTPSHDFQTRRTAEYAAKDLLTTRGYHVYRVAERHSTSTDPFHLIAWNKNHWFLFVKIWSPRIPVRLESFRQEVAQLVQMARSDVYPGSIQFWVFEHGILKRYQILYGGAIRIRGPIDAIY